MENIVLNLFPFSGGPPADTKYIGFENIKSVIHSKTPNIYIINTMPPLEQECLIAGTLPLEDEEPQMNDLLDAANLNTIGIIIYGKHCGEVAKAETKYKQMVGLGFRRVFIYAGGLFEWLLLQDIYGDAEFPTTTKTKDILKYRPVKIKLIH